MTYTSDGENTDCVEYIEYFCPKKHISLLPNTFVLYCYSFTMPSENFPSLKPQNQI